MDSRQLGCGDINSTSDFISSPKEDGEILVEEKKSINSDGEEAVEQVPKPDEKKLRDRIAHCRNIIESLKFELNEEKAKIEQETKNQCMMNTFPSSKYPHDVSTSEVNNSSMYSACVDSRLNCDEKIMEYEKQLENYQTTLNMAQIEKKNAIRKQMLAKAFSLKLMEVENQCNLELLRVKQSLQCLEPLQMIASKWKNEPDEGCYDLDKFELMPPYPEISSHADHDNDFLKDDTTETLAVEAMNNDLPTTDSN